MAGMVPLGKVDELRRKPLTSAEIDGERVVIMTLADGFRVIVNRCPHQQADILHEGTLDNGELTCPLHGRAFDVQDGRCRNGAGRLTFVPSKVTDAVLWAGPVPSPDFSAF